MSGGHENKGYANEKYNIEEVGIFLFVGNRLGFKIEGFISY